MLNKIKKITPNFIVSIYHFLIALGGAIYYRFPTKKIITIGITGTKGKTSTVEILNSILEAAGHKTTIASTLRFKINSDTKPNLLKMTMPGRAFLQKFLYEAVHKGSTCAIIEMTSEGTKQWRHKFIYLNGLIFTNLSPEHIESHGSYEKYTKAKLKIVKTLKNSPKKNKILVTNGDDEESLKLKLPPLEKIIQTHLTEAEPYTSTIDGLFFTYKNTKIQSHLAGIFNLYNILSAIKIAEHLDIDLPTIKKGLENFNGIPGRVEKIYPQNKNLTPYQDFDVIVDYAHTADSLDKIYSLYKDYKKVCVLGSAGGGRDTQKRVAMGKVADKHCQHIILTDEDPYDEDPKQIVNMIAEGISSTPKTIEMDRRLAIKEALTKVTSKGVVIITGKGTDPYIMRQNGAKEPWSDAKVAEEELEKILTQRKNNNTKKE